MVSRHDTQAQQLAIDATTIKLGLHQAFAALEQAQAGWPTQTPGASPATAHTQPCPRKDCTHIRPCPLHDDAPVELTGTERNATTPDKATLELAQLKKALHTAHTEAQRAAQLIQRWAWNGLNDKQVAARLTAIDASIWCTNCTTYGRHEPREASHTECTFCRQFRRDYKTSPPKEIWDARDARNGRIDQTTILRILNQVKTRRKQEAAQRKKEQTANAQVA